MGSLDVDQSSWMRVAWMMAVVDQRHAAVGHGGEVQWVRSRCKRAGVGVRSRCKRAGVRVRSRWCGVI